MTGFFRLEDGSFTEMIISTMVFYVIITLVTVV